MVFIFSSRQLLFVMKNGVAVALNLFFGSLKVSMQRLTRGKEKEAQRKKHLIS